MDESEKTRVLLTEARSVLDELVALDAQRRAQISRLTALGFRSRNLVGEYGEHVASLFYGAPLEPPSTPGFDLTTSDGLRVQVKTLRSTPENRRTRIGSLGGPYDLLFALRLDEGFGVEEALEAPRAVLEPLFGARPFVWSVRLLATDGVRHIPGAHLRRLFEGS